MLPAAETVFTAQRAKTTAVKERDQGSEDVAFRLVARFRQHSTTAP